MLVLHVTSSWFCSYLIDICHSVTQRMNIFLVSRLIESPPPTNRLVTFLVWDCKRRPKTSDLHISILSSSTPARGHVCLVGWCYELLFTMSKESRTFLPQIEKRMAMTGQNRERECDVRAMMRVDITWFMTCCVEKFELDLNTVVLRLDTWSSCFQSSSRLYMHICIHICIFEVVYCILPCHSLPQILSTQFYHCDMSHHT